jgi:hypothetical protein
MKRNNSRAANAKAKVQCVEVLVSKDVVLRNGHNLHWTLCIYSLENEPVKKHLSLKDSAVFHFMVYDWNRTIKQLLDAHQIPYSIVQFFTPHDLFPSSPGMYGLPDDDSGLLLALHNFEGGAHTNASLVEEPAVSEQEHAHLILE